MSDLAALPRHRMCAAGRVVEERSAIFELVLPRIRAIRKHLAADSSGSAGTELLKIIAHKVAKTTKFCCCCIMHYCHRSEMT